MQDTPSPTEILTAVAKFMRETAMPELSGRSAFLTRVAANAVDLVRRQIEQAPAADAAEAASLRTLLGTDGDLETLNTRLCDAIEARKITLATPGLAEHLWATTLAKLAVDQPTYAAYVAATRDTPATSRQV
jgi:hypothetical protein